MHIRKVKNKTVVTLSILLSVALFSCLIGYPGSSVSAADDVVNFKLKLAEEDIQALEVTMSFRVERDIRVALVTPTQDSKSADPYMFMAGDTPKYEVVTASNELIDIDVLPDNPGGWLVTGLKEGEAEIKYKVTVSNRSANAGERPSSVSRGAAPVFPIIKADLKVFNASEALMCPRDYPGMEFHSEKYKVTVELGEGEKLFVPWGINEEKNGFEADGTRELMANFISWGKIDEVIVRQDKPEIVAGFSTDYQSLTDAEKKKYAQDLASIYDELDSVLGDRPGLDRLTLTLCGAERFSLNSPQWCTGKDSTVLFHGGKKLEGEAAASAAGSFFDLWNRFSFVPKPNGDATWFMEGLSRLYPLCAANDAGLLGEDEADGLLSETCFDYSKDPENYEFSIQEAMERTDRANHPEGIQETGAVLSAAIGKRLIEKSSGEKDLSWLAGEVSKEYRGKEYSLDGIVEILERGAGDGWKSFMNDRVLEKHLFLASEIMSSRLFKPGSARAPGSGSSTRNWILLGVAVVVILSMPLIFSSYVRRAVKLDIQMPKILPDDWDDDDGGTESD